MATLPAFGMENNTYPCDNCQEEKSTLDGMNKYYATTAYHATVKCIHILCEGCHEQIYNSASKDDKIWWDCTYCSYLYKHKNKQCWQLTPKDSWFGTKSGGFTAQNTTASTIKRIYPDRILLDVTDETLFDSESYCIIS